MTEKRWHIPALIGGNAGMCILSATTNFGQQNFPRRRTAMARLPRPGDLNLRRASAASRARSCFVRGRLTEFRASRLTFHSSAKFTLLKAAQNQFACGVPPGVHHGVYHLADMTDAGRLVWLRPTSETCLQTMPIRTTHSRADSGFTRTTTVLLQAPGTVPFSLSQGSKP